MLIIPPFKGITLLAILHHPPSYPTKEVRDLQSPLGTSSFS